MIGIFDSGSGGLTVLRAVRKRAPQADIVYFGDLLNAPYGNKTREELGALTVLGIQKLIDEGATEIVSACNSVSVSIVLPMFDILDIPRTSIIEMVGPTVRSFRHVQDAYVLVIATQATIDSAVYQQSLQAIGVEVDGVAIPKLVTDIEGGVQESVIRTHIEDVLKSYATVGYTHIVLGCTHFPLVRNVFEEVLEELGMDCVLVDPADAVARSVMELFDMEGSGTTRILVSKESKVFTTFREQIEEK